MTENQRILHRLFVELRSEARCSKFYCTTCGGMRLVVDNELAQISDVEIDKEFKDPTALYLKPSDFQYRKFRGMYPREVNVSPYVIFLLYSYRSLSSPVREKLIHDWLTDVESWPDWLFDGVSYYFSPLFPGNMFAAWKLRLEERIREIGSTPLKETYDLKFAE